MKNETTKPQQTRFPQDLQPGNPRPQEKPRPTHRDAGRRSLVNLISWLRLITYQEDWSYVEKDFSLHYQKPIDPREFTGTAPPFSWE